MQTRPTTWINPWFAFKASGARTYLASTIVILALSAVTSYSTQSWSWISRAGGVVVLFGVLLSLRRLFRLGPQKFEEPAEPPVVNGNQFNFRYMHQSMQRLTDSFAQVSGISLMVFGTILSSYGDIVLQHLAPFE